MRKFELFNPIRMVFGVGEFSRLGELASQYGHRPLVVVGRSHARESGLLERGLDLLRKSGLGPVVFEGIEPNPRVSTCAKAARMARDENCDMVVGIGGGSVMDASKVIAFGFYDPDNIWSYVAHWEKGYKRVEKALPIVLASTLAATGSEGDAGAVVTNEETLEKAGVVADAMFPKASIIDPELTLTVPLDYTRDGAIDMILHVLESYFNGSDDAPFADRCTEGFFVEAANALEAVLQKPDDLEARSQLSYLGAIALHGFINRPRGGVPQMHMIEHPLSAHFDVSHGRGLALILPRWLRYVSRENPAKIVQFGDRVFGMALETHHPLEAADKVIDRFDEWLESVGAWFYMEDLGIPNEPAKFEEMAESAIRMYGGEEGVLQGIKPLTACDIVNIYKNCVRPGVPVQTAVASAEEQESEADSDLFADLGLGKKPAEEDQEFLEKLERHIEEMETPEREGE